MTSEFTQWVISIIEEYARTVGDLQYLAELLEKSLADFNVLSLSIDERRQLAAILYLYRPGCSVDFIGKFLLNCGANNVRHKLRGELARRVGLPEIDGMLLDDNLYLGKVYPVKMQAPFRLVDTWLHLPTERERELHSMPYAEYLETPEWKAKRAQVLERDERKCRQCGQTEKLRVHHLRYVRVGYEELSDLITLCWHCHQEIHHLRYEYTTL